ncbi:PAS fold protein [Halomonas elongata]|uniref:PAS fold protein n=1 Tax=Halomonas elongata TaxID=2746 RepID=A0A1B8NW61_HALEL|nr:PAS fold protein [Halomonas elongata]
MFAGWLLIVVSLLYVAVLFAIAWRGDRLARARGATRRRPIVYSLALAIYCTSWTFHGAVGQAATSGWSFASIFVGPILTLLLFWPVLAKMIRVAKHQNVTSIADFIASRYGKTQSLAAFASLVALIGTLPYIVLQLKAVSTSFSVLTSEADITRAPLFGDTAFYVALVMAAFAILFGTRHTDATEHHEGLIHAVAFESLIKLVAFLTLGAYVTWGMFDGLGDLLAFADIQLELQRQLAQQDFGQGFWAQTLLAMLAILCLPRQFHVAVVENTHRDDAAKARWLFPLYLVAFGFFVLPLAAAGLTIFADTNVSPDAYVLALPMAAGSEWLTLLTFIGGFSASTGMVIVAAVAVSIMISNEIVIPALFRLRWFDTKARDYGRLVLRARRITIGVILALAYGAYQLIGDFSSLAAIGMLSFAAAAQFAPALIGGLYWKRGNRLGVIVGMNAGFAIWAYSLLMPDLIAAGVLPEAWLYGGPLNIGWLSPTALFGLNVGDSFTHGVMLSLGVNLVSYIFVSQMTPQRVVERIQASLFVDSVETRQTSVNRPWTGATTVGDLKVLCERFLGAGQVSRAFDDYARRIGKPLEDNTRASIDVIQFTERFLASVLGASSARIVVNSALQGRGIGISDVISIVDEASQVLEFNRALLQATIENINQGISVVDQNLRLVVWNQRYLELFRFPDHLIRVGAPIDRIFLYNAHNGEYGPGDPEEHVQLLLDNIREGQPHRYVRYRQDGSVLEVQVTHAGGRLRLHLSGHHPAEAHRGSADPLGKQHPHLYRQRAGTDRLFRQGLPLPLHQPRLRTGLRDRSQRGHRQALADGDSRRHGAGACPLDRPGPRRRAGQFRGLAAIARGHPLHAGHLYAALRRQRRYPRLLRPLPGHYRATPRRDRPQGDQRDPGGTRSRTHPGALRGQRRPAPGEPGARRGRAGPAPGQAGGRGCQRLEDPLPGGGQP